MVLYVIFLKGSAYAWNRVLLENGVESQFEFSSCCFITTMVWQPGKSLDEILETMVFSILFFFPFLNMAVFCAKHFSVCYRSWVMWNPSVLLLRHVFSMAFFLRIDLICTCKVKN